MNWHTNRAIDKSRRQKYKNPMIYCKCAYENVHIRFTEILKYIVPLSSFVSLSLTLKHCLRLEEGMKIKAFHHEKNTKSRVAEVHQQWKLGLFHIIIALLWMWLRNSTEHNS